MRELLGEERGKPGASSWEGALNGQRGPTAGLLGDKEESREDTVGLRRKRPSSHGVTLGQGDGGQRAVFGAGPRFHRDQLSHQQGQVV